MQDPGPSSEGRYSVAVGPGDVILFSRNCGKMYPFPAMLCYCAKLGSWSDWDHVGIVVPYDEEPSLGSLRRRRLGLLEINIGGVTLRPLRERIERSSSHRIAIRKLVSPPAAGLSEASAMEDKLRGAAARLMKMQYNESSLALSNSMLLSHLSHAQRNRAALLDMAAIDRDLSDASAELAAHGITRDASEQRKGATAPLLQKWAASHQQALIEHRQVDVRAVEEHFLLQDCVPYEGQRAVEHYFCSDLVADVLHECGVLHSAVRDRTHMLLPADLSSTASVPGVSLYMNSNSNNKIDSIANCTLHYAMSPDIEFAKKGLEISEDHVTGYVSLVSPVVKTGAVKENRENCSMRVRFAPGDVLPLNWVKGSGGAGTKDLVTMELQSGSIELLAPGYSFADIQSVGPLGTPWSHEAHALFRVARLSDKPDQARSLRYAPPGTFTFDTKDNVEAISGAYCNTGWFLMDEHKNKLKWAWASSIDCRLRAGRDGATVTLKLDRVRDIQAVSGAMNLSSSKACKLNDLSESIYNEALNEVVRLLLPHPAQISLQSSRSSKTLHDEIVRSIRRHTSVLTVDPVHMTQFDSHARDQFINVLGPESPLLVLIEGEMILRCKPGAHSASMEGDPPKQEVVSRLVVGSPAKDANLDSSDLKDKVPTYSIRSGVCVLDAESLLSPTIPQALLMNINANSKFYWVPERTCKFLVLDRVSCIRAGLAYGYGISDIMRLSMPLILPATEAVVQQSDSDIIDPLVPHLSKAQLVEAMLKDRWDDAHNSAFKVFKRDRVVPTYNRHVTAPVPFERDPVNEKTSATKLTAVQNEFLGGRHFLLSTSRPMITNIETYSKNSSFDRLKDFSLTNHNMMSKANSHRLMMQCPNVLSSTQFVNLPIRHSLLEFDGLKIIAADSSPPISLIPAGVDGVVMARVALQLMNIISKNICI